MADWAGDTCRRGNGRLDDRDCENVDGMCCRRLVVRLEVSVVGEVTEGACLDLWEMVILTGC